MERVMAEPPMDGRDLAREVTRAEPLILDPDNPGPRVVGIDTGIKDSIVRNLRERGVRLELHPCTTTAEELLAREPDAVFLANGPGDPAALDYVVENVRGLVGKVPGLGHLPRPPAALPGGRPRDLQAALRPPRRQPPGQGPGHRAASTSRARTTASRCSAPAASRRSTPTRPIRWDTDFGAAELSQLNLYDRTVEGLVLRDVPASTVQYHPEAGPGPHDSLYLFDRFLERRCRVGTTSRRSS